MSIVLASVRLYLWKKALDDEAIRCSSPSRIPTPDVAGVAYGPHERNIMDLWKGDGDGPHPLVVFIHGGGWRTGGKERLPLEDLERLLAAGITVASINYRYSHHAPYPAPMRDGGLAIQFLRHHAERFNIDPARVAAYGGSAGGAISLWLAFRDDLADPDADDPILRQSTRLTCAGSKVGPTSLDRKTMDEWFGMKVVMHPAFLSLFNVESEDELYSDRIRRIATDASSVSHLTSDDPPVFLDYPQPNSPLSQDHDANQMVHHPLFGVKLKEVADRIGIEANFQAANQPQNRYKDMVDFLIVRLGHPSLSAP